MRAAPSLWPASASQCATIGQATRPQTTPQSRNGAQGPALLPDRSCSGMARLHASLCLPKAAVLALSGKVIVVHGAMRGLGFEDAC